MLTKGLLLAVDANSILHRAFHAYPLTLTTGDNQPVNAVYGFTSMFLDALLTFKPEYVFCAFDTAKPTFRHSTYTGYKANRPKTDLELASQIPYVHEVLKALNIPVLSLEGFEADDLLGSVCRKLKDERFPLITQTYILTGDRDLFQLVSDNIQVVLPKGSFKNLEVYDDQKVLSSMGVMPSQITDIKGLMGDSSDNIPGVKGIGPKTASELLGRYTTVEGVYEHLGDIALENKRVAQLLTDDHDSAVMSKQLATISTDAPISFKPEDAETKVFDPHQVAKVFSKLQFKSLFPKFNKLLSLTENSLEQQEGKKVEAVPEEVSVTQFGDLSQAVHEVIDVKDFSYTDRLEELKKRKDREGISIVIYSQEKLYCSYYPKAESPYKGIQYFSFGIFNLLSNASKDGKVGEWSSLIGKLLEVELLGYVLHTGKDDYSLQGDLLQAGRGILADELVKDQAGIAEIALARVGKEFDAVNHYEVIDRVALLWDQPQYPKIPCPLLAALYEDLSVLFGVTLMRIRGVAIDRDKVQEAVTLYRKNIETLEKTIYDLIGFEFNIRSTKQLGNILFGNLALQNARKTKTGYSTDDEVLQGLIDAHPVIPKIIEFRQLTKLVSTYMEPYLEIAEPERKEATQISMFTAEPVAATHTDKRIHSLFSVMATTSGRLSSSNPNLQNLPVKTEIGKVIREFFVAEKGNKILSIDYSQIDLRILAHLSQDETLITAFEEGRDIHRSTASKIFHVPYESVTDSQRRSAKTINFGIVYGMSPYGFSKAIGVDVKEAAKFIDEYFAQFPRVKTYIADTIAFVKETGYVVSLLGRRRFIAGITSNNKIRAQAAEREAVNMPVQGGADDVIRMALGKISQDKDILAGKAKLILQVHDELVFELPDDSDYIAAKSAEYSSIMENVLSLRVPLKAESSVGDNLAI